MIKILKLVFPMLFVVAFLMVFMQMWELAKRPHGVRHKNFDLPLPAHCDQGDIAGQVDGPMWMCTAKDVWTEM